MGRWLAAPALCAAACLAAPPGSVDGDGGSGGADAGRGDGGPVEPIDPGPVTIRSIGPTGSPIAETEASTLSGDGLLLSIPPDVAAELVPGVMVEIGTDRVAVRAIGGGQLLLEEPLSA